LIDVRRLREEPEFRAGIERKRVRDGLLDEVLAADDARRALLARVEELRARQNAASKEIGQSSPDERPAKIAAAGELKDELTALEPALADAEAVLRELAVQVPNAADPSVPDGGEDDAVVVRVVGEPPAQPPALDHAAFAEQMGFVDTDRGAEASGSRSHVMRSGARRVPRAVGPRPAGGGRLRTGRAAGPRTRPRDGGGRVLPDGPEPGLRPSRGRLVPHRDE
jgi:seryl-tRNA synthetase